MAFGSYVDQESGETGSGTGQRTIAWSTLAPTSGNLLVCTLATTSISVTLTMDSSGWALIHDNFGSTRAFGGTYYWKISDGAETGFLATPSANSGIGWNVVEVEGPFAASPLDQTAEDESNNNTVVTSCSTGTTGTLAVSDGLAIAAWVNDSSNLFDATKSYTNSFTGLGAMHDPGTPPGHWFASKLLSATTGVETTVSVSDTGDQVWGAIAVFKPAVGGSTVTLSNLEGYDITSSGFKLRLDYDFA